MVASTTTRTADPPDGSPLSTRRGLLILLLLCGAQFLAVLDATIVNVALPSVQRALHFTPQNLQWVASGYALTFAGFLLLGGRAADRLGRRRVFMTGVLLFIAASLASGLATSSGVLIAARLVQGLGGAIMAPAALSLLTTSFQDKDRAKALGIYGSIGGAGGAAGVLVGGLLTSGPGWRWVIPRRSWGAVQPRTGDLQAGQKRPGCLVGGLDEQVGLPEIQR
jgi:MFS family permease